MWGGLLIMLKRIFCNVTPAIGLADAMTAVLVRVCKEPAEVFQSRILP